MDVEHRPTALPPPAYIIPIAMLGLALLPMPYGYYELLRLVVFLTAALIAAQQAKSAQWWPAAAFAIFALAYNPLFRIHLPREIWQMVNAATIFALVAIWFASNRKG